jgi:hypothetical protein
MKEIIIEGNANFLIKLRVEDGEEVDPEQVVKGLTLAYDHGAVNVAEDDVTPVYWSIYSPEIKAWALEAIERRVNEGAGGFEYADSYRFAIKGDYRARRFFRSLETCCGSEEWEETGPDGNVYLLGFNYGH